MFVFAAFALLALPFFAAAQLVPTAPGPSDVFKQGASCTISWNADTSGKWKSTFIELMTGPNQPMVHLATVANVDGTDPTKTSTSIPCPAVSPNAAIYFYQFTAQGQNTTWTTRFTIADPNGATTAPTNGVQPDGEHIPWGTGNLLDLSQASLPPPTAPPGQVDGSLPGAGTASSSPGGTVLTASAASNSTAPAAPASATPPSPASATPASPASSGLTTAVILSTSSSLPTTLPSSSSANATAHNAATAITRSPPAALVAATLLGLLSLY